MVQLLEELPPELQAHIACCLDDAAAAGRWAQACRASRLLLVPRLEQLLEVRRSARQQAMLDKLSRPRRGAAAALSVVNDMGGGHFAINLAASGAQLRLSMATFTCMCCGDGRTWRCGNAFVNVQMHLASKAHWASHRRHQVYDLDVDAAAWQAFAASVRGLGGSV